MVAARQPPAKRAYVVPAPRCSLAFRVPLTLYHRLLSSNREFTSTDRPEDPARFSFAVMLYESTRIKTHVRNIARIDRLSSSIAIVPTFEFQGLQP